MSFPSLSAAAQGYLITKSANNLSDHTIRNYRKDLERFTKWLKDPPIDTISSRQIKEYFKYLNNYRYTHIGGHQISEPKKLSDKTIQNTWGTLSNFWNWATEEFEIDNPFNIPPIKANIRPIDPIPQEEIQKLLKACDAAVKVNGDTRYMSRRSTAKRDKAIVLLLLDAGLRVTELCELTLAKVAGPFDGANPTACPALVAGPAPHGFRWVRVHAGKQIFIRGIFCQI